MADAFLGNFQSYSEASADPMGHFRFNQIEGFIQDNWKVSRKLSLDVGLRYQWIQPFYLQGNNASNFDAKVYNPASAVTVTSGGRLDPSKGGNPYNGLIRAGDGVPADQQIRVPNVNTSLFPLIPTGAPRGFYKMNGAVGPRFGFAYAANDKTTIRGGIGLFYYRAQGNLIFSQLNLAPFLANTQFDTGNLATVGSLAANNTGLQASVSAIDPTNKNPYTWQYSFGFQRQVTRTVLFEMNYVGSISHHQLRQPNVNFADLNAVVANANGPTPANSSTAIFNPYKGFTAINSNRFDSNYNYNSLQMFASKRAGFTTFTLSYTFSKALGDSNNNNGNSQTFENWSSLAYNYGSLSNDRRHAFVASFVVQAPDFKGHNFLIREAVGGWQVSGVARLQSGAYFNVQGNSLVNLGSVRPDRATGVPIYINNHAGINGYLTKGAFVQTPKNLARFGTAGYAPVEGPGLAQTDATLSKFFPITERVRVKIQADAFNILNRTNFNGLNVNISNTNYGTFSSAFPPRQLQLGARLLF
jgi:hypothetical protein